jgi:hypothetical protein
MSPIDGRHVRFGGIYRGLPNWWVVRDLYFVTPVRIVFRSHSSFAHRAPPMAEFNGLGIRSKPISKSVFSFASAAIVVHPN